MAAEAKTVGEIIDHLPAPRTNAAVTPMQMLQMAIERGGSMETLEKLMALQERWEANEARKAFVAALNAFKADPPTIVKNRRASFGGRDGKTGTEYDYVTLDQVSAVIGAALAKHGLSHRWEVAQGEKIRVTCVLTHELGHSERVTLEAAADTSGSKNSIQAIGSTVTYLERYTLLAATGLAAKGQDDDGAAPDCITDDQKQTIIGLMRDTNADTKRFLGYMGVATLDELPAHRFQDALAALNRKRTQGSAS